MIGRQKPLVLWTDQFPSGILSPLAHEFQFLARDFWPGIRRRRSSGVAAESIAPTHRQLPHSAHPPTPSGLASHSQDQNQFTWSLEAGRRTQPATGPAGAR